MTYPGKHLNLQVLPNVVCVQCLLPNLGVLRPPQSTTLHLAVLPDHFLSDLHFLDEEPEPADGDIVRSDMHGPHPAPFELGAQIVAVPDSAAPDYPWTSKHCSGKVGQCN